MIVKKSFIKREFFAGATTFLTMSYILIVNPSILSTPGTGLTFSGVLTATVLLSFSMTLLMGLYAKLPYAVAPGMGINAFFTYTLILGEKIPWPVALGMVFWAGVLFLIISATPLRESLAKALPHNIKIATTVGIGIFLAFIGLKNSGFVIADPITFLRMGPMRGTTLLSAGGLILVLVLTARKSHGAFLITVFGITIASLSLGYSHMPPNLVAMPDFTSGFFKLDLLGSLKWALLPAIFSVVFTDLFDSISTFVGVARAGNLLDEKGDPIRLKEGLIVDSFATLFAGLFGTSPGTAYVESAAGIEAGGRTGLTSVFTALFFLPFLFLAPFISVIPIYATAPVLICVGMLMFKNIIKLQTDHFEDWIPAVMTVLLIPLTFSITKGLFWGLFTHLCLFVLVGRRKELKPFTVILGLIAGYTLYIGH